MKLKMSNFVGIMRLTFKKKHAYKKASFRLKKIN